MLDFSNTRISKIVAHRVANKSNGGKSFASSHLMDTNEELEDTLKKFFLKNFKTISETFRFTHGVDLSHHTLNNIAKRVFGDNRSEFLPGSVDVLNHLYNQADHPKIKEGDLFVVLFDDILIEDELAQALGVFKCERKDTFIKLSEKQGGIAVDEDEGISLRKIDKAALILNIWEDEGYRVFCMDNHNYEAEYWTGKFLGVEYVRDHNFDTRSYIDLCKAFSEEIIKEKTGAKSQIEFLSESMQYMELNDEIADNNFQETLFEEDETLKREFTDYKKQYEEDYGIEFPGKIEISQPVLKKQKRGIRALILTDTGIQIKLNLKDPEASRQHMEKGYDEERQMHYYKVYYNEEV